MEKSENIVNYAAEELLIIRDQGRSHSDFSRTNAMSEQELQEAREADPTASLSLTPE